MTVLRFPPRPEGSRARETKACADDASALCRNDINRATEEFLSRAYASLQGTGHAAHNIENVTEAASSRLGGSACAALANGAARWQSAADDCEPSRSSQDLMVMNELRAFMQRRYGTTRLDELNAQERRDVYFYLTGLERAHGLFR